MSNESKNISLPVLNLSCVSCAGSVERILKSQDGILDASVNFANTTAQVNYAPEKISLDAMKKIVQSIGYDLVLPDPTGTAESTEELQKKNSNN